MKIQAQVHGSIHEIEVERIDGYYRVTVDGDESYTCDANPLEGDFYSILMRGKSYEVSVALDGDGYRVRHGGFETDVRFADPSRAAREGLASMEGPQKITSVMPGKVVRILVEAGDAVQAGQGLVVVEAMKMENEIESPKEGVVKSVDVDPGQAVETGGLLCVVE